MLLVTCAATTPSRELLSSIFLEIQLLVMQISNNWMFVLHFCRILRLGINSAEEEQHLDL